MATGGGCVVADSLARQRHWWVYMTEGVMLTGSGVVVALENFRSLKTFQLTFLRMRNKCNVINNQRHNKALSV